MVLEAQTSDPNKVDFQTTFRAQINSFDSSGWWDLVGVMVWTRGKHHEHRNRPSTNDTTKPFKRSAVETLMLSGQSAPGSREELKSTQYLHKWKQKFKALPGRVAGDAGGAVPRTGGCKGTAPGSATTRHSKKLWALISRTERDRSARFKAWKAEHDGEPVRGVERVVERLSRPEAARAPGLRARQRATLSLIQQAHEQSRATYGFQPARHRWLQRHSQRCYHGDIVQLMPITACAVREKRRFRVQLTDSNHDLRSRPIGCGRARARAP